MVSKVCEPPPIHAKALEVTNGLRMSANVDSRCFLPIALTIRGPLDSVVLTAMEPEKTAIERHRSRLLGLLVQGPA